MASWRQIGAFLLVMALLAVAGALGLVVAVRLDDAGPAAAVSPALPGEGR